MIETPPKPSGKHFSASKITKTKTPKNSGIACGPVQHEAQVITPEDDVWGATPRP